MFHVDFIGLNREGTAEFYLYHVLWSIPTPAYPEPYVTVSVFFCIAASRVQPPHFPVDVSLLCIFSALSLFSLSCTQDLRRDFDREQVDLDNIAF